MGTQFLQLSIADVVHPSVKLLTGISLREAVKKGGAALNRQGKNLQWPSFFIRNDQGYCFFLSAAHVSQRTLGGADILWIPFQLQNQLGF